MASEKDAALAAAAAPVPSDSPTIFDKIINKEIPSNVVYEDDKVLAFRDINPQAPTHIVIIPKVKDGLSGLSKAEERHCEILGRLMYTAKLVAKQEGLDDGFRIVINDGPNGCMFALCSCHDSFEERELWLSAKRVKDHHRETYCAIVMLSGSFVGQSVYHIHVHLLGGRQMNWPPG
ncbi:unnamed protein product [Linum tenue]|uniref:HIT domain-containing protein n=1 Tax=Linum tenue TaxID=586396 RepID=A0AAV0M2Z4_9ROSI|nr:unnamed protein product [Linum tenue]